MDLRSFFFSQEGRGVKVMREEVCLKRAAWRKKRTVMHNVAMRDFERLPVTSLEIIIFFFTDKPQHWDWSRRILEEGKSYFCLISFVGGRIVIRDALAPLGNWNIQSAMKVRKK